jgi:hypothetical protein
MKAKAEVGQQSGETHPEEAGNPIRLRGRGLRRIPAPYRQGV